MTEQERNDLANDLYWIHDLVGQASPCESGLQVSEALFNKAKGLGVTEYRDGKDYLKYFNIAIATGK